MPRTWLARQLSARALSVGTATRRMTPPAVRMCGGTSIMSNAGFWSMRLGKAPSAARCVCVRGRMSVLPARFLRGAICHWIHRIFIQTRTRRRTHERFAMALLQEKSACAQSLTNKHARTGVGCHLEAFQSKLQLKICGTRTVRRVSVYSVFLSVCQSVCVFCESRKHANMNKDPAYQSTPTNIRTEQTTTIHPQPSSHTLTPARTHRHTRYTYLCACGTRMNTSF